MLIPWELTKIWLMKRNSWFLVAIFVLGLIVRLYRFDGPVADWHSFRQSDTNAVSVIYAREGINLVYPRYFDISNIQSGIDNPKGYRFVEFPIYNAVQAGLFNVFGMLALEEWGRLISIFSSLFGALFVFLLTKKYADEKSGFFAAFFYLFLPYSIYYSRTILPDPSMAAAILGGTYFFDSFLSKKNFKFQISNFKFWFAVFFTALAFLLKPFALFFIFPMVYSAYKQFGLGMAKRWQLWLFAISSLIPIVLWRKWIGNFPEGIPASSWLFNGDGIRFRPAFFRWIGFERITKLILGYAGILLVAIGGWQLLKNKNAWFFLSFVASCALYVIVVATGNVRHDYYQIAIIPTISIFGGLGVSGLFKIISKRSNNILASGVCAILIILSIFFSWGMIRDYFNINDRGMVEAGNKADQILPKDAIVIAPYDGSTVLLNFVARRGWPTFQRPIEELIANGATYLVIANPTPSDFSGFGTMYEHIASSPTYLILKLK